MSIDDLAKKYNNKNARAVLNVFERTNPHYIAAYWIIELAEIYENRRLAVATLFEILGNLKRDDLLESKTCLKTEEMAKTIEELIKRESIKEGDLEVLYPIPKYPNTPHGFRLKGEGIKLPYSLEQDSKQYVLVPELV